MANQKTDKQERWEKKQAKNMRFLESEAGWKNNADKKILPPYAYTPLCPDPKYRTGYQKKKEEEIS